MEKGRIISVKCPYCGLNMKRVDVIQRTGPCQWTHQQTWRCNGNCVYFFTEEWFNDPRFQQFESCITREKPSEDKK